MVFIVVLIIYLAVMLFIGILMKNRVKNSADYYVAGRTLPWPVLMLTMAATYIGATATLAKTGLGYTTGMSAIMSTIMAMLGMAIFGILSPKVNAIGRKYEIASVAQLIRYRFGLFAGILGAIVVLWAQVGTLAGQVTGAGSLLPVVFNTVGLNVSYEIVTLALVLIMIVYTLLSGMFGVAYTDVIQVLILLICLACFLPAMMINAAGGWDAIKAVVPESYFSLKPGVFIIGLMFNYFFYFMSGPPYWQRAFAAKTPKSGRVAIVSSSVLIIVYTVLVTIVGIAAVVLYPELPEGVTQDSIVVIAVLDHYSPFFAALIVTAVMAAIMSTMDSYLLTAAQAVVSDIVKAVKPDITLEKELRLSKIMVVVIAGLSYLMALYVRDIIQLLQIGMGFYSSTMAAPLILGTFWKKATKEGCLAAMFCGCAMYLVWRYVLLKPFGLDPSVPGGCVALIVMIVVSLLTYKKHPTAAFEITTADL